MYSPNANSWSAERAFVWARRNDSRRRIRLGGSVWHNRHLKLAYAVQLSVSILGGLFLCLLGIETFLSKPTEQACPERGVGLIGAYGSTFLLKLTNPMTILSFAGIFASFGLGTASEGFSAAWLVLWVFAGSASWWLVLSCTVAFAKDKMSTSSLMWINRTSGVVIFGFGVLSLAMLAL